MKKLFRAEFEKEKYGWYCRIARILGERGVIGGFGQTRGEALKAAKDNLHRELKRLRA